MLHLETVGGQSFAILKKLMTIPELQNFNLVGGTALSLVYGHRLSVDLDLFYNDKFENEIIVSAMKREFGDSFVSEGKQPFFGIFCYVGDLKIDIVRFPHPLIEQTIEIEGIRMYAPKDIVAMKVQAILGCAKKKDFWDIAELLKHFTVANFVAFHKEKFSTQYSLITVPQVMTYFDDAEDDVDPISLKGQTWETVKREISAKVSDYLA
jgi:predicted nucleotidyltransferase component of viral defense system